MNINIIVNLNIKVVIKIARNVITAIGRFLRGLFFRPQCLNINVAKGECVYIIFIVNEAVYYTVTIGFVHSSYVAVEGMPYAELIIAMHGMIPAGKFVVITFSTSDNTARGIATMNIVITFNINVRL